MEEEHIYHRLSKNKNKLPKLNWGIIYDNLKGLYPESDINFHRSEWYGTYIVLKCNSTGQEIRIELNKSKYYLEGKKIKDISKNSFIFYMKQIDLNIINIFTLQSY